LKERSSAVVSHGSSWSLYLGVEAVSCAVVVESP
jgi:hypothetical protein